MLHIQQRMNLLYDSIKVASTQANISPDEVASSNWYIADKAEKHLKNGIVDL